MINQYLCMMDRCRLAVEEIRHGVLEWKVIDYDFNVWRLTRSVIDFFQPLPFDIFVQKHH